jgi:hypothetical protein
MRGTIPTRPDAHARDDRSASARATSSAYHSPPAVGRANGTRAPLTSRDSHAADGSTALSVSSLFDRMQTTWRDAPLPLAAIRLGGRNSPVLSGRRFDSVRRPYVLLEASDTNATARRHRRRRWHEPTPLYVTGHSVMNAKDDAIRGTFNSCPSHGPTFEGPPSENDSDGFKRSSRQRSGP